MVLTIVCLSLSVITSGLVAALLLGRSFATPPRPTPLPASNPVLAPSAPSAAPQRRKDASAPLPQEAELRRLQEARKALTTEEQMLVDRIKHTNSQRTALNSQVLQLREQCRASGIAPPP